MGWSGLIRKVTGLDGGERNYSRDKVFVFHST